MSKYKAKVPKTSKDKINAQDLKDEKQFFKVAIIATVIIIILIYLFVTYLS
jgi:hypothetical protein